MTEESKSDELVILNAEEFKKSSANLIELVKNQKQKEMFRKCAEALLGVTILVCDCPAEAIPPEVTLRLDEMWPALEREMATMRRAYDRSKSFYGIAGGTLQIVHLLNQQMGKIFSPVFQIKMGIIKIVALTTKIKMNDAELAWIKKWVGYQNRKIHSLNVQILLEQQYAAVFSEIVKNRNSNRIPVVPSAVVKNLTNAGQLPH